MKRSTFKVLFYLKRRSEKNGKAPIMGRITVNGTVSQFSCKLSVSPKLWDTGGNRAAGKSVEARRINEKLENIKTNIGKQYQRISDRDSYVTAEKVKNAWLGFGDEHRLLLQTFDEYLQEFAGKRVGKDRSAGTLAEYRTRRDLVPSIRVRVKRYSVSGTNARFRREVHRLPIHRPGASLQYDLPHAKKAACYGLHGPRQRLDSRPPVSGRMDYTAIPRTALSERGRDTQDHGSTPAQLQNGCRPGYFRVLLFYGPCLCGRKETDPRRYTHGRQRGYVDYRRTAENGHAVSGAVVARRARTGREIPPPLIAGRDCFSCQKLLFDDSVFESDSPAGRDCNRFDHACCAALVRHVGLPVAGRSDRDGIEDARAQAYHDHADIRENHQRQDQAGYGSFTGPDRRQVPFSAINPEESEKRKIGERIAFSDLSFSFFHPERASAELCQILFWERFRLRP